MIQPNLESCFQLKGSNVTAIVLELSEYPSPQFAQQLQDKVQQAPAFFQQSAIVISLEKLQPTALFVDLTALVAQCRAANLHPMAFKGGDDSYTEAVTATGLPWLPANAGRNQAIELSGKAPEPQRVVETVIETVVETVIETVVEEKLIHRPSKVITRPVRGGQQIYAEGADLIVMSQVSEGAEVLADGNIHIYGPLRGRALAGVKGDQNARVFCQQMEAELVSVAGVFMLSEELRDTAWKQPAQISFEQDKLTVSALK